MTTEEEQLEDEYDENDPFGLNKPRPAGRRISLGALARENAVVRRRSEVLEDGREAVDPYVVGYGKLEKEREDEERPGYRPGTYYRPFF